MYYSLTPKIFIGFVLFSLILFLESGKIGSLNFAAIWKIPIVFYLIYYTYLKNKNRIKSVQFVICGGLFCLIYPLHSNILNSILPEIMDVTKIILIPTTAFFLFDRFKHTPAKIVKLIFWFSVFLIWSNVPYLFGIINPVVQKDYTEAFGEGMSKDAGFSGPFLSIHAQGVIMAVSVLFIINLVYRYPKKFRKTNLFLLATVLIGVYCLYLSFARTGWLFFIISFTFLFLNKESLKQVKNLRRIFIIFFLLICGIYYLIVSNESFRRRLFDEREYVNRARNEEIGSGRLWLTTAAISNWKNSDLASVFMGYGIEKGFEKMNQRIGLRLIAHNGYVDILQRSGVKGIVLFLLFIILLFRVIKESSSRFSYFTFSIFFGWLLVGAVQEFTMVYLNIYLGLAIGLSMALKYEKADHKLSKINE